MKKITLLLLVAALNCALLQSVYAEVKLPAIVSSNMVLQRNTTVKLWGWADANEKITIKTSWLKKSISIQADGEGNWKCIAQTTNSKEPQSITIKSKESNIKLENILFGEVWLCSGQSNMEMPMKGYAGQPIFGSAEAVAKANNPNLRLFSVTRVSGSKTPLKDAIKYSPWQQATPESVLKFSAVGYLYGKQLQEILDVPVGLILSSWGGSSVQAWMSNEALSKFQTIDLTNRDIAVKPNAIPTALFNSMLNPIIPYTIKGAIWYQGESNVDQPAKYKELFPAMVEDWRKRWDIGNFPFYYVQIAPYLYGGNDLTAANKNSAFFREVQLQCLDIIPNSGIAITMDLGAESPIHPPRKKEVADRLLYNALNQTYGLKSINFAGPVFDSMTEKEGGLLLKFKNEEIGIYAHNGLEGFEIAGSDKVFYPANAKIIDRKAVLVISDKVPNPVAVRYDWNNWVKGTLLNTNLLPASSFRTDDWPDATKAKK
ncbi:sialate O-acetylesterase [Flavobacterium nackdongense]|uniref:Sialate O-acetylesterase n=1 Tax=Flavobacterium nackdongense TaxID=2547394 RepID=A0A4P6YBF1_9FLAO|nr:sialate O-acetylesterase [Flavobacterium nackdongense]QBN20389.1 sialate O-acetylesterase [Flavobacterium nackdongense]